MDASPSSDYKASAAHRVFACHELSATIFSFFGYHDAKRSLARLARTCKMFFKPAIENLWYELECFPPVLHALPPDCWEWADQWHHLARLKREFSKEECERLFLYTSQIRFFHDTVRIRGTDLAVYQHFSKVFEPRELFPCLRKLQWGPEEDELFPYIKIFLGPQLEHIEITIKDLNPTRVSIFPALESCSTLQTALLLDTYERQAIIPLSKVVTHWKLLRTLEIFYVSPEVFAYLASLPSLTTLKLGSVKGMDWDVVQSHIQPSTFPSLETLKIGSGWMKSTTQMIEIAKYRVSTINIIFEEHSTADMWKDLLGAVQNHVDNDTLKEFAIKEHIRSWISEPGREKQRITAAALSSLFTFKNLTSLRIVSTCGFDFDDTLLLDLALSLPKIKSLRLLAGREWDIGRPSIKLDALAHLSRHCQHLEDLGIHMVAEPEDLPEYSSYEPGSFICPVKALWVGNSPIKHPIRVAHLLSDWFPHLEDIWTNHPQSGEVFLTKRAPRWHKVKEFVKGMALARRQERNSGCTVLDPDFDGSALPDEDSVGEESDNDDYDDDEDDEDEDEYYSEDDEDDQLEAEYNFNSEGYDEDDDDDSDIGWGN
ncbi:hypothetical protein BDN72DRAFT_962580 [Pluteus cervinus]|uniref:Uncharacterized protein n=1 Tax=Pluteus cervinus TaxID=181527 RepID=A0ACD3AJE1_9AGAR|nr:hypothetical protein BDN72DRAFT_962580 [Pluteus cervinus]